MILQHICPFQKSLDDTLYRAVWRIFMDIIICFSFQIMENLYGKVVVGDVLCIQKICGGCTQMVIEVRKNVIQEVTTRTSKLRK